MVRSPSVQVVSWARLLALTAAFAGTQLAWAVQIGFATPEMRKVVVSLLPLHM